MLGVFYLKMVKWRHVEAFVLNHIVDNHLPKGSSIPSDSELAQMVACSKQPVIRALQELERKGVVQRSPGRPSIILDTQPQLALHGSATDFSFRNTASRAGVNLETRILELSRRPRLHGEMNTVEERAHKALGLT